MSEDRSTLIEKIRSLLRKAEDERGNQYERILAMTMAQRLILKHKISEASLKNIGNIDINVCEKVVSYFKSLLEVRYINIILQEFFEARVILSDYPNAKIISTDASIDFAVYVYDFLKVSMQYCFKHYRKRNPRTNRGAYLQGFCHGLYTALEAEREKEKADAGDCYKNYEIVLVSSNEAVENYIAEKFTLITRKLPKVSERANASYGAGYVRGQSCKINKPIQ
jgi:hypothetical protein